MSKSRINSKTGGRARAAAGARSKARAAAGAGAKSSPMWELVPPKNRNTCRVGRNEECNGAIITFGIQLRSNQSAPRLVTLTQTSTP